MKTILGLLVIMICGWAVWSFVVRPAVVAAPQATPTPVVVRPTATPTVGPARSGAVTVAQGFLSAWASRRYDDMYDVLSPGARVAITATAFTARYNNITNEATITKIQPVVTAASVDGNRAVVTYTVDMSTTSVGAVHYTDSMPLHYSDQHWTVGWTPDLIFPGLGSSYRVHLYAETAQRGAIVDRLGRTLALQGAMMQVGVVPQYIQDEKALLAFLSSWLHMPATTIQAMYNVSWAKQNPTDFVPIASVTSTSWNSIPLATQRALLSNGLEVDPGAPRRIYPKGPLAAPLIGYVNSGGQAQSGLEAWGDRYLSGQDGAKLAIATANFDYTISTIKEKPKHDGATIHLTLDATLQAAAEHALAGKVGAVVAIRPSDGAVLAMASTPGYDPNLFAAGNPADSATIEGILNSPHQPLINRAATGQYPLGSIFKLVTAGAALEKLGFTRDTTRFCAGIWTGLGAAYAKRDWLPQGHGTISLHEAIVQSCDIYFYQVGLQLYQTERFLLPDFAKLWGFGAPTGIVGVREGSGIIPDQSWIKANGQPWYPGNAVDMAIGQGYVAVTPLQVAQMLAAMADGGVIHRPYVVGSITAPDGTAATTAHPVITGHLPISAAHLQDILDAMHGVTTESLGTAADKFAGFNWSVAGKTGTAQAPNGQPYAWFASISPVDHPRIAMAVMVEQGGEGSAVAAPLTRQILQTFYTQDRDLAGLLPQTKGPVELPVP